MSKKTDGTDFEGIEVEYNDYGNHWIDLSPKYTDANGNSSIELFAGTYSFRAKKNYSYQTKSSSGNMEFQTATAKALVKDCDNGDPIAGIEVEYNDYGNHWIDFSPKYTDASGNSIMELFPGTFTLRAKTIYTYLELPVTLVNSGDVEIVEFNPTRVCFNYAGTVKYNDYGNHWLNLPCDTYMFPGTYDFRFGSHELTLPVSGCAFGKTVNILILKDHNGDPLSGGTARGGYGNNHGSWHVSGSTDANGVLFDIRNGNATTMSYEMKYNNTTSVITGQDVTVNSIFEFQTELITMRLETCGGTPLDGGHVRWGHGASFGTYHFVGGNTGSSATGETNAEFFPGTYSFEMGYNGTTNVKSSYNFPGDGATLIWQTINVTLQYSGSISFGGPTGDSRFFNQPSMELMPGGTYKFNFRNGGDRIDITIENGCSMVKSAYVLKLITSTNSGISGQEGFYRLGGPYYSAGLTNVNGKIVGLLDGLVSNNYFKMKYLGHLQTKLQNIALNSIVTFQTVAVTVEMRNSGGGLENAEELYYRNGVGTYVSLGTNTSSETIEMLPLNYYFRAKYLGHHQTLLKNVTVTNPVTFQTVAVTVEMRNSGGGLENAEELYYRNGVGTYVSLGTNTSSETIEMLPLNYYFRAKYLGHHQTLLKNVTVTNPVTFQTVAVTVEMRNSGGGLENAEELYYRNGVGTYVSLGTNTSSETIEMLPLNYYFRAKYLGHHQTLLKNVTTTNPVVFQTISVEMKIQDATNGNAPLAGTALFRDGTNTYVQFGVGTTTTKMEMLPLNYYFRASYSGEEKTKLQNVSNNPNVLFTWDGNDLFRLAGEEGTYKLENNYPNPFDRSTIIKYSLPEDKKVSLMIYDMNGKLVKVLVDEFKDSGDHEIEWDASDESGNIVPGGIYYYQFKSGTLLEMKSMIRVH